jgi:SAM-dependent methyltransferase
VQSLGRAPFKAFEWLHHGYVHERRTDVLSRHVADLLPQRATVLDIGAGDGLIAKKISERRPDLDVRAVEVLRRPETHLHVELFDGKHVALPDKAIDVALLIDVLHHAEQPLELLREADRVARRAIVVKDVRTRGILATETLHLMEVLANTSHGISIPETFWSDDEWRAAFDELHLNAEEVRTRLGLYPFPATVLFERSFHFVARLVPRAAHGETRLPTQP